MRMEVSASENAQDAMLLYRTASPADMAFIATGSDGDIGGLSRCRFSLEREVQEDGHAVTFGRFYGTVSSQVPRNSSLERSGYAAFRNKLRPTLFGSEMWDTSFYPYLALRVRNRTPVMSDAHSGASLRAALHANDPAGPAGPRAVQALGLGEAALTTPPLFFVNVQTDGPVTTDLYQHRLWLDASDTWQTVTIPLDSFVLTNTGVVSEQQVSMLREKLLTVGVSVLLSPPELPSEHKDEMQAPAAPADGALAALRRKDGLVRSSSGVPGSQRDQTVSFALDIDSVWAVASPEIAADLGAR